MTRKRRRRRRRNRATDPRERLVGAWQETLDVLAEGGLPGLGSLTSTEVAAAAASRFGAGPAERVRAVGDAANAAIFSTAMRIGPDAADAAWRDEQRVRSDVREALTPRQRLATALRYGRPPRPPRIPRPAARHSR